MYTLEDDSETSSRYKRDLLREADTVVQPALSGGPADASPTDDVPLQNGTEDIQHVPASFSSPTSIQVPLQNGTEHTRHFSLAQFGGMFKQLTLPDKEVSGKRRIALAALTVACCAVFLTALDQTVVVTALPQIIGDLQIPITQLDHAAWIISTYLLGFIVAMPLMGRVSDIYGRRRIFLLCLAIFGLGSIFCGLAPLLGQNVDLSFLSVLDNIHLHIDTSSPGLVWLVAARLVQAAGGGAMIPVAMAIAGDFYGEKRRALALGIIGAVTEAGGALGPLYGALVVEHLGWQYIFYLNVPIVVILIIAVCFLIPKGQRRHERVDWLGALLIALALTCLSLGLAQQGTSLGLSTASNAAPQNNPIALVLAVVFLLAFILVERKVRWPVIDLGTFKRLSFSATSLVSLFVGAALIIALADIPIFVDTVLRLPVMDSGLALLRLTVMIPIGALLGGWLCNRITCRLTAIIGLLFTASGFFLMSRWSVHVDWTQMTVSTLVAGFGFGLVIAPIGTTAINSVKATQAGMGSAVVTAFRMIGMMLGLAALTSWALAYFRQLAASYPSLPAAASAAQFGKWAQGYGAHLLAAEQTVYTTVFFISMLLCLIAIIPAVFLWGFQRPEPAAVSDMTFHDTPTLAISQEEAAILAAQQDVTPTMPVPLDSDGGNGGNRGRMSRRRRIILLVSAILLVLLVGSGVAAAFLFNSGSAPQAANSVQVVANTPTPVSGPRMVQLALDKTALTSIFAQQLSAQPGALSDLNVVPGPDNGLVLSMNLHIDFNSYHRILPVEMDGKISLDQQQNLQLSIQHVKRDGLDAGPAAATSMQTAVNQMLISTIMPTIHTQLKGVKLISAQTSTTIVCGKGAEMLVLQIEAPPIQGIAAQLTPVPFCLTGQVDLSKLLP